MLMEIELGVLCACALAAVFRVYRPPTTVAQTPLPPTDPIPFYPPPPPLGPHDSVEILCFDGAHWCHHSWREPNHSDILEALRTPGLAIRHPDRPMEEGYQAL